MLRRGDDEYEEVLAGVTRFAVMSAEQHAKGLKKYGKSLGASGLPLKALVRHALEEVVDLFCYLHEIEKRLDEDEDEDEEE